MTPTESFPLTWPTAWPRWSRGPRENARFNRAFASARDSLLVELRRLGATDVVLTSNVPVRRDGLPSANFREPDDPGVSVWYRFKGKPYVLACDKWRFVADNMRALAVHVEALRGIDRWGVGEVEQAFAGYLAIPGSIAMPPKRKCWEVFDLPAHESTLAVTARYRELAAKLHPDAGGTQVAMAELNIAMDEFKAERGLK